MPEHVEIRLPSLAAHLAGARIGRWKRQVGQYVVQGDALLELLADSVSVEIPSTETGVLIRQLVQPDAPLRDGQAIALVRLDQ